MSLKEFFDSFDNCCTPVNTTSFEWTAKGFGFGGMYFYFDENDSYVHCENELMSREFLKEMLCNMVDNCVLDCPGSRDEAKGIPPGYNPRPYVKSTPVKRIKKSDQDSTSG